MVTLRRTRARIRRRFTATSTALRSRSRREITIAMAGAALAVGVAAWLLAAQPFAAGFARHVMHAFTPGWPAFGRVVFALCLGAVAAAAIAAVTLPRTAIRRSIHRARSWTLFAAVTVAVVFGLLLVWAGYLVFARSLHVQAGSPPSQIDILRTALTAVAGVGGAVALVVAYRRQRDLEQGRFVERFGAAATQLGDTDPAVRIAGVYAMAAAADEATTFGRRQQCIDVLCGYLRLPYEPSRGDSHLTEVETTTGSSPGSVLNNGREVTLHQKFRQNDREIRQTIVRVVNAHLQDDADVSWSSHDYDFTGVTFEDVTLASAVFRGFRTSFDQAIFQGNLTSFDRAKFAGTHHSFSQAVFQSARTTFNGATFSGETLFDGAHFGGDRTSFINARFEPLVIVSFARSTYSGGMVEFNFSLFLNGVDFAETKFDAKDTSFGGCVFEGSGVSFVKAQFNGGSCDFDGAAFGGRNAYFSEAGFHNKWTTFRRPARWDNVQFDWDDDPTLMPTSILPPASQWPPKVTPQSLPPGTTIDWQDDTIRWSAPRA